MEGTWRVLVLAMLGHQASGPLVWVDVVEPEPSDSEVSGLPISTVSTYVFFSFFWGGGWGGVGGERLFEPLPRLNAH